jgi:predicted acetyltransferase
MRTHMRIQIHPPNPAHRATITNLATYFRYDLLPFVGDTGLKMNHHGIVADGDARSHEQSVAGEQIWWSKPGILLPMLITVDDEPAGFVNVARPPHAHPQMDYRIEDLFIVNKWRRAGVGRRAIEDVCPQYSGKWEVGWLPMNLPAERFWRAVTAHWNARDWPVEQAPGTPALPGLRFFVQ